MTITEALAELKTLAKRVEKKQQFVSDYLFRLSPLRDPFEKDGGSVVAVTAALQSLSDLEARQVALRLAITNANLAVDITVEGITKTIAEWLVWRREVAPGRQKFLQGLKGTILGGRRRYRQEQDKGATKPGGDPLTEADMIVHLDEQALNREIEQLETVLGQLDGQLSLKNATVMTGVLPTSPSQHPRAIAESGSGGQSA